MRSPTSPQRRGAPVVDRVLQLALEELAAVGFHRLSLPDLAARAGLHKTSVDRRWPTKAALVGAALSRAMGHDDPLPDTGALASDVLAFTLGAVAWAETPAGRAVTRTLLADADDPEVRALVASLRGPPSAGPRALFQRAIDRGELRADADIDLALTVLAGAISHRQLVEAAPVDATFAQRLVALVVGGLLAPHA
jgi:AcrR family transcriptional regulator